MAADSSSTSNIEPDPAAALDSRHRDGYYRPTGPDVEDTRWIAARFCSPHLSPPRPGLPKPGRGDFAFATRPRGTTSWNGRSPKMFSRPLSSRFSPLQYLPACPGQPGRCAALRAYGYSAWHAGPGTNYGPDPGRLQPYDKRTELAPDYGNAPNAARLLTFFSISDIHIADKESPAQPIYLGWSAVVWSELSQASCRSYSPIILSTTHVLDAAVQTINALHKKNAL